MKDKREQMVHEIKVRYGLNSPKVLSAMLQVPRYKFVSRKNWPMAYRDSPVPIGYGQTMSQPYTVAVMTELMTEALNPKHEILNKSKTTKSKIQKKVKKYGKALEIGTGSGYQAAVLSKLFRQVYTIEIVPQLARRARSVLARMGYKNVHVKKGSGEWGWKDKAPFDAIMITAGVKKVPDELFEQLKAGGVLVAPVGKGSDKVMMRYTKLRNKRTKEQRNRKTKERKNKVTKTLSNQVTKKPGNKQTKQLSNQLTKQLKTEKHGIFHFVPFVKEGN